MQERLIILDTNNWLADFFDGLQSLAKNSFPKKCKTCGKIFYTIDDYTKEKLLIKATKGIEETDPKVDLYQNCTCGESTLEFYRDRRDASESGAERRKIFHSLLKKLEERGIDLLDARIELIKIINGQKSENLNTIIFKLETSFRNKWDLIHTQG